MMKAMNVAAFYLCKYSRLFCCSTRKEQSEKEKKMKVWFLPGQTNVQQQQQPAHDFNAIVFDAAGGDQIDVLLDVLASHGHLIDTPNPRHYNRTPLFHAASNGRSTSIETLVRLGSRALDTADKYGWTPAPCTKKPHARPPVCALLPNWETGNNLGVSITSVPSSSGGVDSTAERQVNYDLIQFESTRGRSWVSSGLDVG